MKFVENLSIQIGRQLNVCLQFQINGFPLNAYKSIYNFYIKITIFKIFDWPSVCLLLGYYRKGTTTPQLVHNSLEWISDNIMLIIFILQHGTLRYDLC